MKYLLFVVLLVFAGCGPQTKTIQENKNNKEAILIENKESEQKKDVVLSKQSLIQGVWAENEDGNALFNIEKDSLYYLESQNKPLYYNLIGDTLFVYGDVLTKFYIVKLNKDSLWFKTNFYDEITKLYKRKSPPYAEVVYSLNANNEVKSIKDLTTFNKSHSGRVTGRLRGSVL